MLKTRRDGRLVSLAAIALLVVAATAIRAPGLGRWCYTIDEFYFSQSVSFILEKGIPEFSTGGYYTRGLLVQYLAALPALVFGQSELTDRLFPLLFGIAGIAVFYVLARRYLREPFAFACAAALVVSSWHIEFSRFARFYSAFQLMFLLFLYALYRGYWRHERRYAVVAWATAFLAVFTYEGAIFLPFFAVLLVLRSESLFTRRNLVTVSVAGALLACNYIVNGIDYRNWGIYDRFPEGFTWPLGGGGGPLQAPILDLFSLATSSTLLSAGLGALAVLGAWVALRNRHLWSNAFGVVFGLACLALPLIHQYGTLVLVCGLYVLSRPKRRDFLLAGIRAWGPYLVLTVAFWVGVVLFSGSEWQAGESLFVRAYRFGLSMFSHFGIHSALIMPLLRDVPIWSSILFLALGVSLVRNLRTTRADLSRFPLVIVTLCLFLLPVFDTPYRTTRYSFFFFPIALSLLFTESFALSRWIGARIPRRPAWVSGAAVVIPFVLLFGSEDVFFRHWVGVSAAEINFRTERYEPLQYHWYARIDFESPAEFINEHYRSGDVIVLDAVASSRYLEPPFVNYVSGDLARFRGISRKRGTTEIWTGEPLRHDLDGVASLVPPRPTGRLWLVAAATRHSAGSFATAADVETFAEAYGLEASLETVGVDGRVGVWRVERQATADSR